MKKFILGFICGAVILGTTAVAATDTSYSAVPAWFKVLVNGEEFTSDPPALIVEGRTYLPLRAMGDALGVPVEWNEELKQAEVGTVPVVSEATIDNEIAQNEKWKMTYTGYKSASQLSDYQQANDGKEFLIFFFDIENVSDEENDFSSLFYLDCYVDDIKTQNVLGLGNVDGASPLTSVTVASGKKSKGYLAFEVDPSWEIVELIYDDDLFHSDADDSNVLKFTLSR